MFGLGKKDKWSEAINDDSETLLAQKLDGGLSMMAVTQKYGNLHKKDTKSGRASFKISTKVPILKNTILGGPRTQDRLAYFSSTDEGNPYEDPDVVYNRLKSAYQHATEERREEIAKKGLASQNPTKVILLFLGAAATFFAVWTCGTPNTPTNSDTGGNHAPAVSPGGEIELNER